MNQVVLILISILAIWKIHDLFFPEKTKLGKQLIVKIIELKLTQAFYRDFLVQIIKDEKVNNLVAIPEGVDPDEYFKKLNKNIIGFQQCK